MNTHFVIDESASMMEMENAVYDGVREMLASMSNESSVSVSRFNHVVTLGKRMKTSQLDAVLSKRTCTGRTALYDAIHEAIQYELLDPLSKTHIVVVTDGLDNASKHRASAVRELILKVQKEQNWSISFLGCNQDAVMVAKEQLGIERGHAITYDASKDGLQTALRALSENASQESVAPFTSIQRQASLPANNGRERRFNSLFEPPPVVRQSTTKNNRFM